MNSHPSPGAALAALRQRVEKICPECGVKFMGYANTGVTGCKIHAGLIRQRNRRAKLKEG
ncbi:hypothetical protein VZ94_00525 [Methylocucumis oryzae]|uniref:Uncharacterized protein n=1 Tax=Methylocucumis oryzae TaxID=1632867 RepID=A0A0F3IN56_9GAMM|nr:hypothetical protein VZ94_00525 [Methylocucumis oryzae]